MGALCCCCRKRKGDGCCAKYDAQTENESSDTFKPGGKNDLSNGPVKERGCTDIVCALLFIAAQVIFIIVTLAGMEDGDPTKLWKPRDFMGNYCGVSSNWNGGPDTENQPMMSFTMNVSAIVEPMLEQTLCSTAAQAALTSGSAPLITDSVAQQEYLCNCCLSPCTKCVGSKKKGIDFGDPATLLTAMSGKMGELTDFSKAAELFSPGGLNGDMFSTNAFWEQATVYLNEVCLPGCSQNSGSIASQADSRTYVYSPSPDHPLYPYWDLLVNAPSSSATTDITTAITQHFTFPAFPETVCPYEPVNCVPMSGMTFSEVIENSNYCSFEFASEVTDALGSAATSAFESIGAGALTAAASTEFGGLLGEFQQMFDTFIIVSVLSFVFGLVFLVLLRFFIGICVWLMIFVTLILFFLGGSLSMVMSSQCTGTSIFDSGHQTVMNIVVAGQAAIGNEGVSEDMSGDGADYRGIQSKTISGITCLEWETQTVFPDKRNATYPDSNLIQNYCRNPYPAGATDDQKASTIWCVTSDPNIPWETCAPVGIIQPECQKGYVVSSKSNREALNILAYVIWAVGLIFSILVCCMYSRIKLAIALNKVAAKFLASNPQMLLIPVFQSIFAILWTISWILAASYLVSQVPDSYTPMGAYTTYAEAYGTASSCSIAQLFTSADCAGTPGKCTDSWPTGSVWRTDSCEMVDGVAACWRCSPPRYILDWRFWVSFFVFLWNNAFNVALGQILVAMAVGLWFFSANKDKGTKWVMKSSIYNVFRYHLGSVAFGSFLVALVQFIRYVLKYVEKQATAKKNKLTAIILKCMQCCLWCFEKCLKFLNKNAYIQVALLGTNFCASAKKAFFLILRNMARFGTMVALAGVIHGIGFVCIIVGTVVSGYFILRGMHSDLSPLMPCVMFFLVSYVVAKLYMNVFGLAVDTSMQCFLAVEEMGVGGNFVPEELKDFVEESEGKRREETH